MDRRPDVTDIQNRDVAEGLVDVWLTRGGRFAEHIAPSLQWVVSDSKDVAVGDRIPVLGRFTTQNEAAEFISTLPEYETGRYNLDGPREDI
jgi:hypothetical protein